MLATSQKNPPQTIMPSRELVKETLHSICSEMPRLLRTNNPVGSSMEIQKLHAMPTRIPGRVIMFGRIRSFKSIKIKTIKAEKKIRREKGKEGGKRKREQEGEGTVEKAPAP